MNEFDKKDSSIPGVTNLTDSLLSWLRKDVIYLAVSQDDQGLGKTLMSAFPNILVLTAGGFGHVPIPLIGGKNICILLFLFIY